MSKVELRLTEVEPPAADPPRTIYTDLVNLPDPARLGLTCRIFNYDDVGLYMRVDGYKTGWTFTTNDLGLLGSGANMYRNLDNFGSRAKPAAELTETITVRLRAYTDSGYTNLKWTYERVITAIFVNSADPSYTVDVLNNFDDGTVQGWSGEVYGYTQNFGVATDFVLSTPYSLRNYSSALGLGACTVDRYIGMYKQFTTPNKDIIYAIMDFRFRAYVSVGNQRFLRYLEILKDSTLLVAIGVYSCANEHAVPDQRWIRIVVLLPKNTTLTLHGRIHDGATWVSDASAQLFMWLDNFKIISK